MQKKLYVGLSENLTRFFTNLAIIIKCKLPILIICVIGPNFGILYKSIIFPSDNGILYLYTIYVTFWYKGLLLLRDEIEFPN